MKKKIISEKAFKIIPISLLSAFLYVKLYECQSFSEKKEKNSAGILVK